MRIPLMLAAAAIGGGASAQNLVIPAGFATTEGSSSTAYPWGRGSNQIRVQYVYDASHFTNQGVNSPIVINNLKWRANGGTTTAGYTYSSVQIGISSAAVDYTAVTTTFANNHGPDFANVYNGAVVVATPAGTTPNSYYVDVAITPFLYDPSLGADLCIDVATDAVGATTTTGPALDSAGTAGLTSRVYNLTNYQATTGTTQQNSSPVVEVGYTPANGLFAAFSSDVTRGPTPLTVNFTDQSFTSAAGGVTSWAWDFDGNGTIDSTLQNPTHVYNSCGSYDVTLTVNDGVNPASTLTQVGYIVTDEITADFTSQLIGPLVIQFTDTSTPAATSWAWDFDGDGSIDSNLQDPIWVAPNTNVFQTSLTAARLCGAPSTIVKPTTAAQILSTNLAANNGGAARTILFDLEVLNPNGVEISAFDSVTSSTNASFTVDVYLKPGSYVGSEANAGDWTLVGQAAGTSAAVANAPSNAVLGSPLYVPQGTYGVALFYTGINPRYVTGAAAFGNGDLGLTLGAATVTATPFVVTNTFTPRAWSGSVYYGTHNITGSAGFGFFAPGCPGSLGVTNLSGSQPTVGSTLTVDLNNVPFGLAVMISGSSNSAPLPLDLGFLGAPGCFARVSLELLDTVIGVAPNATWTLQLPNNPVLSGQRFYSQAAVFDNVNALGLVTSDAAGWIIGG